jgi:predicted GIY-YIG superfamily endonuclease
MPIIFNRVARKYKLTISSTDEDKLLEVASLAEKLGLDVTIDEEIEGVKASRKPRVESMNWLYGIWRNNILGYIGYTKDPDRRFKEHANRLEFASWLLEGVAQQDIKTAVSAESYPLSEAKILERRYVRQLNPPYNTNERRIMSLDLSGGDLLQMLS